MNDSCVIFPRYHGRTLAYESILKQHLSEGHDVLVCRAVDFKNIPPIPERPIKYEYELNPYEAWFRSILEDHPVVERIKQWLRSNPYVENSDKNLAK